MKGEAALEQISLPDAMEAAKAYFESALERHGIEHLNELQLIQDHVAELEKAATHRPEVLATRRAG